uniref:Uncharacterized protein n=2 Tax=Cacopsylla melanoneura TaxID=428564 RepID=A0A8D8QDY5_9HEMI
MGNVKSTENDSGFMEIDQEIYQNQVNQAVEVGVDELYINEKKESKVGSNEPDVNDNTSIIEPGTVLDQNINQVTTVETELATRETRKAEHLISKETNKLVNKQGTVRRMGNSPKLEVDKVQTNTRNSEKREMSTQNRQIWNRQKTGDRNSEKPTNRSANRNNTSTNSPKRVPTQHISSKNSTFNLTNSTNNTPRSKQTYNINCKISSPKITKTNTFKYIQKTNLNKNLSYSLIDTSKNLTENIINVDFVQNGVEELSLNGDSRGRMECEWRTHSSERRKGTRDGLDRCITALAKPKRFPNAKITHTDNVTKDITSAPCKPNEVGDENNGNNKKNTYGNVGNFVNDRASENRRHGEREINGNNLTYNKTNENTLRTSELNTIESKELNTIGSKELNTIGTNERNIIGTMERNRGRCEERCEVRRKADRSSSNRGSKERCENWTGRLHYSWRNEEDIYWSENCAVMLNYHRNTVTSNAGLRLVELRGSKGLCLRYWSFPSPLPRLRKCLILPIQYLKAALTLVAIDNEGAIVKVELR